MVIRVTQEDENSFFSELFVSKIIRHDNITNFQLIHTLVNVVLAIYLFKDTYLGGFMEAFSSDFTYRLTKKFGPTSACLSMTVFTRALQINCHHCAITYRSLRTVVHTLACSSITNRALVSSGYTFPAF